MGHRFIATAILISLTLTACGEEEKKEPVNRVSAYQSYIAAAEAAVAKDKALGLTYVHPKHRRACKTMQFRLSAMSYDGIDKFWEPYDVIDIQTQWTAPPGKRDIGAYPVFFDMPETGLVKIDAFSCTDYHGEAVTQYQTFAEFDPQPGQLLYIGDFTQTNLAQGVDLYLPELDSEIDLRISGESTYLASLMRAVDAPSFRFTNYDGNILSARDVMENVNSGGDYYVLSNTLKAQANQALAPFLDYIPDLAPTHGGYNAEEALLYSLTQGLKLAFFRQDLHENFNAILKSGKSFKVARDYVVLRVEKFNKARTLNQSHFTNKNYGYLEEQYEQANAAYDRHVRQNRLADILDKGLSYNRKEARNVWRQEARQMPFVMLTPISNRSDELTRQRIQTVMSRYTPAKYASLKLEFSAMADQADLPPAERRHLRRLIDQAEAEEAILLEQLIASFMRESLQDNAEYHAALARLKERWGQIMQIWHDMTPIRANRP